jgi:hypothetical protein
MKSFSIFIITCLLSTTGFSQSVSFTNLTQSDFDKVSKEFSGNFMHHSVMGASSLGTIFGFELGLIGGMQKTPEIDALVKRADPSKGVSNLIHAGLLGVVGIPFGLSAELVMVPKLSGGGGEFQYTSMGLKWTMTDELLAVIPFNIALRGTMTNSTFSFKQTISGGIESTVENKNSITGLQLLVSPRLPIFEPYAGIGMMNAKNTLSVSGTGTVFDSSFTTAQSADSSPSSTQYLVGANVRLLVMVLGLEVSSAFGATQTTGKFSFAF